MRAIGSGDVQRGDSVAIQGQPLLGAVYRAVLLGIAHRRANGVPGHDLQELARLLYRAYNMSPQRHELDTAADTPEGLKGQDRDSWIATDEAAVLLGRSRRQVQRMARAPGGLDSIRVGRTYAVRLSAVLALAQQRKKAS